MKRWLALAIIGTMLAVPAVSAGPWMQPRGDAAATGFQPEEGPSWPDVALRVELEGSMRAEADSPPLILEDQIVFLARPYGDASDDAYRVLSVDRSTGEVTAIGEVDRANRLRLATDGHTVYVTADRTVHAFPLDKQGHEWSREPARMLPDGSTARTYAEWCGKMALEPGNLTVLCSARRAEDDAVCQPGPLIQTCERVYGTFLVARLDAATGSIEWVFEPPEPPNERELDDPERPAGGVPVGLAVSSQGVYVQAWDRPGFSAYPEDVDEGVEAGQVRHWVWALKPAASQDGEVDWTWSSPPTNQTFPSPPDPAGVGLDGPFPLGGNPALADGAVFVKAGDLYRLNAGTGEPLWNRKIGEQDVQPEEGRSGALSLDRDDLYTTSAQTIYRMDRDNPSVGWSMSLNFSAGEGFSEQPIVTPSTVYATTFGDNETETILAVDAEEGDVLWRHPASTGQIFSFSTGHGVIAYTETAFDGDEASTTLVLLGRTATSPTPTVDVSSRYPAPGEPVEVDLSTSEAGLQGPVTRYKAIWGDGAETDWQADPVLNHTYEDAGDVTARFVVANDANQTNSTTVTFHVGQEAPTEPNLVETAFKKDNQDMTFGILGLLVAVTGGAIGVTQRYRKRSLLQDELDALEAGFEDTKETPSECEALLDNRKARARSLALDGKLEEDQVGIVENRAEELRAELRTGALEEEFGFLPYSLVTKARQMVEDGTVTALEREAFLRAVDEDDVLTSDQKALVRERIEQWFARDAGGGGP